MSNWFINILTFIVALCVSGVAGYFSIYGLGLIFPATFLPVVIMGIVLEAGKIIAVSWLYRHWHLAPTILKTYLIGAVLILMFITSLGVFGYLSRSHFETESKLNSQQTKEISLLNSQVQQNLQTLSSLDKQINLIDDALNKLISTNRAQTSLRLAETEKKNRQVLLNEKNKINQTINDLQFKKSQLELEVKKQEVEVGPIRYAAEFVFGNTEPSTLERAVRWMIIIIVFVFDPLAIALIIAANHGLYNNKLLTTQHNPNIIEIDKSNIKQL